MAYNARMQTVSVQGNYNDTNHLLWACTFAVVTDADDANPDDVALAGAVAFVNNISHGMQTDKVTIYQASARRLHDDFSAIVPLTEAGALSGATLPADTAAVSRLRTADNSRRGRGRFFVPYVSADFLNDDDPSSWTSGALTTFQGAIGGFETDLAGGSPALELGVWSRLDATVRLVTSVAFSPVPGQMGKRRYG